MSVLQRERESATPPISKEDKDLARLAQRCIMEALDRSKAVAITLESDDGQPPVTLPPAALRLIGDLLGLMSQGKPITLIPEKQELTTVEAANFLNVSRPFVIKEIEAGRIKHRMVGSHRRIPIEELVKYAQMTHASREEALDELSQLSHELDLDY